MKSTRLRGLFDRAIALAIAAPAVVGCGTNGAPVLTEVPLRPWHGAPNAGCSIGPSPIAVDCSHGYHITGDPFACGFGDGGMGSPDACAPACSGDPYCRMSGLSDGTSALICVGGCPTGRRPAGYAPSLTAQPNPVAAYFALVAQLEAASVGAFHTLAAELRGRRASRHLLARASAAARDEVRHARVVSSLARRFGAKAVPDERARRPLARSLEAVARENAVEGCVRETYGALAAAWQARAACDPEVRAAMAGIARDETRHAALAWSVARWAEARLDAGARGRVRRARRAAVRELEGAVASPSDEAVHAVAGVPRPNAARALFASLERDLWASSPRRPSSRV